jgi:protein-S-isoprenylcysteine O-methyltransferase Ste14
VVGGGLAMASGFFLVLGGLVVGFLVARTRIDEEKLLERFGDEYRDFMRRTGRFLPCLKS